MTGVSTPQESAQPPGRLNILSKEKGEHFHDFDVPADAERVFGEMSEE